MLFALPGLIVFLACAGCSRAPDALPPRPPGLPATAAWVGGADGGVYVDITVTASGPPRQYLVRIFDVTGDLDAEGIFARAPGYDGDEIITVEAISGWDGEKLLLVGGGALIGRAQQ